MKPTININIRGTVPLVSPQNLIDQLPMTERSNRTVVESRDVIKRIIAGQDRRILAIVGPCSIHDREAGMEYARKLRDLAKQVSERIFVAVG